MSTPEPFVTLRRYTRTEVAAMLNIPDTWLKRWVTDDAIPHRRSGAVRGVWFTYDDVLAIGVLLPALMTPRQANGRAERRSMGETVGPATDSAAAMAASGDHSPARFHGLRSLHAR
jgi:hypothetical protein